MEFKINVRYRFNYSPTLRSGLHGLEFEFLTDPRYDSMKYITIYNQDGSLYHTINGDSYFIVPNIEELWEHTSTDLINVKPLSHKFI